MSVIVTDQLCKLYGDRLALDGLSLDLQEGTICGFLGPNGVGKTTAIRILLGFIRPSSGRASIFGLDCWRDGARIRSDVGYIPGDLRLHTWLTAKLALKLFSKIRGQDFRRRGMELVEEFKLDADVRVGNMSRGMRQKLGLILALAPEPRLLVLDEPTTTLDPVMQDRLKSLLSEMASRGHTVFFSSHALGEVEQLCERVIILRAGRMVADSTIDELRLMAKRELILGLTKTLPESVIIPDCLEDVELDGLQLRAKIHGSVLPLLQWLPRLPLEDVVIRQPDMESVFQQFYRGETDESRPD